MTAVRQPFSHRAPAYLRGLALLTVAAAPVLFPACTSGVNVSPPRAFNGPTRMAFVCFDVTDTERAVPVRLAECTPTNLDVSDAGQQTFAPNRALHALITQRTRGEVGAVNLTTRVILDSDIRIPGATFVPVGELPTDIVVSPEFPACAWVASAGERTITAIPTARFRPEHDRELPDEVATVSLPSRPGEMILSPDSRTLWVSLPDLGAVARIAIDPGAAADADPNDCAAGAADIVELTTELPAPVAADVQADLLRVCIADAADPTPYVAPVATITPRTFVPTDPRARPMAMELDVDVDGDHLGGEAVLLIADANLPLIHRVDIATATELAPIEVGAPVRDIALTPWVPDNDYTELATGALVTSRYIYAIDERDGSVMAIAYGAPTDPGFGAVLPIDGPFSTRPDRMPIPVPGGAMALDVLTPGFAVAAPDPRVATPDTTDRYHGICAPLTAATLDPTPQPNVMRGVFVGLAMTDGTVRFADVYDLDAPCRGSTFGAEGPTCGTPSVLRDENVYIRRHRLRAGLFLDPLVRVFDGPTFTAGNQSTVRVAEDGSAGSAPALAFIDCPAGMGDAFPNDGGMGLICTQLDPFSAPVETFNVAWQGTLPGTAGTGNLGAGEVASEIVLESQNDFCFRGVIAADAAAAVTAGPEVGYVGDMLAITTLIDDDVLEASEECQAVVGIENVGEEQQPILVPIARAYSNLPELIPPYAGRLVVSLDAPLLDPATGQPRAADLTLADALACLPDDELVSFDVRSRAQYIVFGQRTGFLHRVVEDADGRCVVDTSISELRAGRLGREGRFESTRIAFQITEDRPEILPPALGLVLSFRFGLVLNTLTSAADAQLLVDIGAAGSGARFLTLPSEIVWSDQTQLAYVIEPERRGLVEIETPTMLQVGGTRLE